MRRALVAALVLCAACAHDKHKAQPSSENEETEAEKGTPATGTTAPGTAPSATQTPSGVQVAPATGAAPPKPLPPKIKIIVRVTRGGPDKALVFWGKKKLGEAPVTLERPRDSGPVDLVVRGEGFFPLHTRAYTFRNDVLYVKMTKLDDRMTLFGAKRDPTTETPPGGTPDGGTPLPPP